MSDSVMIKDMPFSERPYEKLEQYGSSALSDSELLAIIIKTGTKSERATDIALRVLGNKSIGISNLHHMSLKDLRAIKGIGRVKAIQLKAVAEISSRLSRAKNMTMLNINSPSSVASIYMESMRYLEREHMKIVLLDTKNNIIDDFTLSVGTVNASLLHPREVFLYALKYGAVNILLLHNHPSGNPEPSPEDIQVTKRISEAGQVIGITLIDHIIIGNGDYSSLKELGYL